MNNELTWIYNRGTGGIVATIDSGVDVEHTDLRTVRGRNFTSGGDRNVANAIQWTVDRGVNTINTSLSATDRNDERSIYQASTSCPDAGSNFGSWVDVAAPGSGILSTFPVDDYAILGGTSMATPNVAGVVDLLRSNEPSLSTRQVRDRLVSTGTDIGDQQIGPLVDSFEATFNGSFEGGLGGWHHNGDAKTVRSVSEIRPWSGKKMAWISTGPGSSSTGAALSRTINVDTSLLATTSITLRFRYNFLTAEFPEWIGSEYNDYFRATATLPSGEVREFVTETVNTTAWTLVPGLVFPSGSGTVGQSGWKSAQITIPVADLDGENSFRFEVRDVGDDVFDSVALIDEISLH